MLHVRSPESCYTTMHPSSVHRIHHCQVGVPPRWIEWAHVMLQEHEFGSPFLSLTSTCPASAFTKLCGSSRVVVVIPINTQSVCVIPTTDLIKKLHWQHTITQSRYSPFVSQQRDLSIQKTLATRPDTMQCDPIQPENNLVHIPSILGWYNENPHKSRHRRCVDLPSLVLLNCVTGGTPRAAFPVPAPVPTPTPAPVPLPILLCVGDDAGGGRSSAAGGKRSLSISDLRLRTSR
jgi:hypothetical protein